MEKTFWAAFKKRQRFVELYRIARPLIESKLREGLDATANFEGNQFIHIKDAVMRKDLDAVNEKRELWGGAINRFLDTLSKTIQEQIAILIEL